MPDIIVGFSSGLKRISLVVRGKLSPDHHPDKLDQHADCILQNGAPIGFFGEGNDGSLNGIGLGMNGVVYDYQLFQRHRPHYVDMNIAIARRVVSTVLVIEVDQNTANRFDQAWAQMRTNPGSFDILGNNCATHASAAFIFAGVVTSGIPWMDTPDNLYGQLVDTVPAARRTSYSGFTGFLPVADGFQMQQRPYVQVATTNTPNQGSWGGSSGA
jgi:hypothetical protein